MSLLSQINITAFRNIASMELAPSPSLNVFYGKNGSGKTSILEAISVMAHGRSFRTHKYRRLIKEDESDLTLFSRFVENDTPGTIGISRQRNGSSLFKVDGKTILSSALLAEKLPILTVEAHSFALLEGVAKIRRQFFDWLVFHVKHEYKDYWKRYAKCVKQRNSLLRSDKISTQEIQPWDKEIAALAVEIERLRQSCLDPFKRALQDKLEECRFNQGALSLEYVNGWKKDTEEDYITQLSNSFERDRRLGYTSLGPHKSDLKITFKKAPAVEVLSRGQQKVLIVALFLAEAQVFIDKTGRAPVFLLDDIPSELDTEHMAQLGEWIDALGSQVFLTSVSVDGLEKSWPKYSGETTKVFHVKHGQILNFPENVIPQEMNAYHD